MNLTPVSLTLAVSTAWAAIFLGALHAPALRFYSREILGVGAAWVLVALTAPALIFHWYLILAFMAVVAWFHVRRERFLAGKVWLSIAAGLGISIGVVFYLQSASALFPAVLPGRDAVLLLASLYLGGAIAGASWTGALLWSDPDAGARTRGFAGLLLALALAWLAVVLVELALPLQPAVPLFAPWLDMKRQLLLAPLALLVALSALLACTVRRAPGHRTIALFVLTGTLAFATQLFARLLLL